ncbi:hypothetical protein MRB53_042112 [Persea americana]|nr:hypothetical protein MRB53_042112 [Persea americana]
MDDSDGAVVPPDFNIEVRPPPKSNFWNARPAWASTPVDAPTEQQDDDLELFRRSDTVAARLREEEQRNREKRDKKRAKRAQEAVDAGPSKKLRSRTPEVVVEKRHRRAGSSGKNADLADFDASLSDCVEEAARRPHTGPDEVRSDRPQKKEVVMLLDSSDEEPQHCTPPRPNTTSEAVLKSHLSSAKASAVSTEPNGIARASASVVLHPDSPPSLPTPAPSPQVPDAIMKILITSPLGHSEPFIIKRKMSQRLKEVRLAWIEKQPEGFHKDYDNIYLTWRGRKVFDLATCASLGLEVDDDGSVHMKGDKRSFSSLDEELEADAQLHMIATTAAMVEKEKQAKQADQSASITRAMDASIESQPAATVTSIRLILRAEGYTEYKLTVRPILDVFRDKRQVPADKTCFLMFDGDRLDAEDTVADSDISDADFVDVYVR